MLDGRVLKGTVVGTDPATDIAGNALQTAIRTGIALYYSFISVTVGCWQFAVAALGGFLKTPGWTTCGSHWVRTSLYQHYCSVLSLVVLIMAAGVQCTMMGGYCSNPLGFQSKQR